MNALSKITSLILFSTSVLYSCEKNPLPNDPVIDQSGFYIGEESILHFRDGIIDTNESVDYYGRILEVFKGQKGCYLMIDGLPKYFNNNTISINSDTSNNEYYQEVTYQINGLRLTGEEHFWWANRGQDGWWKNPNAKTKDSSDYRIVKLSLEKI